MGKVQSKHGDCIVVNAHFNPVCQLDDDLQRQKPQAQTFACSVSPCMSFSCGITRDPHFDSNANPEPAKSRISRMQMLFFVVDGLRVSVNTGESIKALPFQM